MRRRAGHCTRLGIVLAALALAGCADDSAQWARAGVKQETVSADYEDCRQEARSATQRDAAIDADILASRGGDWQRSGTLAVNKDAMATHTKVRSQDIIASCMAAKGYKPAP